MPNVKTLTRFSSDLTYVAEMRYAFGKDENSVRRGYFELVAELEELLYTERLLREKVLAFDSDSRIDRLWGSQLSDYTNRRALSEIPVVTSGLMADDKLSLHNKYWKHLSADSLSRSKREIVLDLFEVWCKNENPSKINLDAFVFDLSKDQKISELSIWKFLRGVFPGLDYLS